LALRDDHRRIVAGNQRAERVNYSSFKFNLEELCVSHFDGKGSYLIRRGGTLPPTATKDSDQV
jgi:hypothetical protein